MIRNIIKMFPYLWRGRWYRIQLESDGVDYSIASKDIDVEISGTCIVMPEGFHIVDSKSDINSVVNDEASNYYYGQRIYANSKQGVIIPDKTKFDYATIYIFGYFA